MVRARAVTVAVAVAAAVVAVFAVQPAEALFRGKIPTCNRGMRFDGCIKGCPATCARGGKEGVYGDGVCTKPDLCADIRALPNWTRREVKEFRRQFCHCPDGLIMDEERFRCVKKLKRCKNPGPAPLYPGDPVIGEPDGGKSAGSCDGPNMEVAACGSKCDKTCDSPDPMCVAVCEENKCQCKRGFLKNAQGECVAPVSCPAGSPGHSWSAGDI